MPRFHAAVAGLKIMPIVPDAYREAAYALPGRASLVYNTVELMGEAFDAADHAAAERKVVAAFRAAFAAIKDEDSVAVESHPDA